jgi:hypothetical protein
MSRPFALRALEPTHGQALNAVLAFLERHPQVAWVHKFNVGAHVVEELTTSGRRKRRYIEYAFPGCADLLGQLRDGRFLAVEVKVKRDRLSQAQRAFLATVNDNGGIGFVARSIEDVVQALGLPEFRAAAIAWQGLNAAGKCAWKVAAIVTGLSGYQLFLSEHMTQGIVAPALPAIP